MKIVPAGYIILGEVNSELILKSIEAIARTCYKSEDKITDNSSYKLVKFVIDHGHEAMLEHEKITVKFYCDRGISHEIVRHRIGSYAQESTRYCNYSKQKFGNEITVISPCFYDENSFLYNSWRNACEQAERSYFEALALGATPEEARTVLPTSLKTELVCTYNLREWRYFLRLRTAKEAHPQMRELTIPLLKEFQQRIPIIFDDITHD